MGLSISATSSTVAVVGTVQASPAQRRRFLVVNKPAASETYASTNYASPSDTSDIGLWESEIYALPASLAAITLTSTPKKARIAFPSACSVHGRSIEVMFTPATTSGTVTVAAYHIATNGTATLVGTKAIAIATAAPLIANLGIADDTDFLADEAIEFRFSHGTSINLTFAMVAFNQY